MYRCSRLPRWCGAWSIEPKKEGSPASTPTGQSSLVGRSSAPAAGRSFLSGLRARASRRRAPRPSHTPRPDAPCRCELSRAYGSAIFAEEELLQSSARDRQRFARHLDECRSRRCRDEPDNRGGNKTNDDACKHCLEDMHPSPPIATPTLCMINHVRGGNEPAGQVLESQVLRVKS